MHVVQVNPAGHVQPIDSIPAARAAARAAGHLLWLEFDHPIATDLEAAAGLLHLHPLAIEDAVHARERPKLDLYESQKFASVVTLAGTEPLEPLRVGRLMAFVGEDFVVTIRQEDGDTLERLRRRAHQRPLVAPLDVLHALMGTVVDDLTAVADGIEAAMLATADRLFADRPSDEAYELYHITRNLLLLSHAIQPLIEPLRHLSTDPALEVEGARRFQDVLDHGLLLDRQIRDDRELAEHLRGSNDSRIGLQQNTDMRRIAAWAAVVAVPTAITGFYGMNVPYPGFGEPWGAVTAAFVQLCLAAVLIWVLRRRRWL